MVQLSADEKFHYVRVCVCVLVLDSCAHLKRISEAFKVFRCFSMSLRLRAATPTRQHQTDNFYLPIR